MIRRLITPSALILFGVSLAGCNTSAPGVLPRTDVPPPPSLSGRDSRGGKTVASGANGASQRRAVTVPGRLSTPAPTSTNVEPVMTGKGIGAGFKF